MVGVGWFPLLLKPQEFHFIHVESRRAPLEIQPATLPTKTGQSRSPPPLFIQKKRGSKGDFCCLAQIFFDAFFILSLLYGETRVSRIFSRKSLRFHGLTSPTVVEGGVEHEAHEDLSTNRLTDSNDIRAFLRVWMKEPKVVLAAFDHNRKSKHIPSLPETKSEFTPENGRPYSDY